jgi:crotonobetainyl-CoA:carnitine CoA-transferase CaiB-like acyl-CoA transferase
MTYKVLDLTGGIAGGFCARNLAMLGMAVIKVEPSGGDRLRTLDGPASDLLFEALNCFKLGVSLDFADPSAQETVQGLLLQADVLVLDELAPLYADSLSAHERLREQFPHLVIVSVTPWGTRGDWAGRSAVNLTLSAAGGDTYSMGYPDREPLTLPYEQCYYQGGVAAVGACLASLYRREHRANADGDYIDIAVVDIFVTVHSENLVLAYTSYGGERPRYGHRRLVAYPYQILPCKDGYVSLVGLERRQWDGLVELMGNPEWAKDERFRSRRDMIEIYADELDAYVTEWLRQYTKAELFAMFRKAHLPFAPLQTVREVLSDEQLAFRKFWYEARGGGVKIPGLPFRTRATRRVFAPAPGLGQHNDILATGAAGAWAAATAAATTEAVVA